MPQLKRTKCGVCNIGWFDEEIAEPSENGLHEVTRYISIPGTFVMQCYDGDRIEVDNLRPCYFCGLIVLRNRLHSLINQGASRQAIIDASFKISLVMIYVLMENAAEAGRSGARQIRAGEPANTDIDWEAKYALVGEGLFQEYLESDEYQDEVLDDNSKRTLRAVIEGNFCQGFCSLR
ncbi:hypothetical protein GQ44DRAFT_728519 [Phaeosphaeriaceae sp. PMI808]|nr:hypothetical protein GQ44DRAFT_728519 [Phaeosphaeriaceae sp. PMI808]